MRLTGERITLLMGYGLTEYQARAYLALLENPMSGAGTLAHLSHVPRNRLYGVLDDLQRVGLVEVHLGDKRRYKAQPFSNYLDKRKHRLLKEVEEIDERREYLDTALAPAEDQENTPPEVGTTRVIRGRSTIREEIERMIGRAESSAHLLLTPGSAQRFEPHVHALAEKMALEADAFSVEVFLAPERAGDDTAERFDRILPGRVRISPQRSHGIVFMVDQRELLYVHPIPDDRRGSSKSDFAIHSTNSALLSDVQTVRQSLSRASAHTRDSPTSKKA